MRHSKFLVLLGTLSLTQKPIDDSLHFITGTKITQVSNVWLEIKYRPYDMDQPYKIFRLKNKQ